MEFFNEKVYYENPLLSLRVFQSSRNNDDLGTWHYHKELEILVILDGYLDVYVEEEYYAMKRGDVVLIGSNQLHRDRSFREHGLTYIVLQFDIQQFFGQNTLPYLPYFAETKRPLSHLNYIFEENPEAKKRIFDYAAEIHRESSNKSEGYEIAVNVLINQIILTLLRADTQKALNYRDNADMERLKPVLDYIEQNIMDKIQVEEASKVANISYYYFVKYFKKVVGMSFTEYVNYQKIKRAERILLTKDISITQVGESIGMPNMAHFYKIFKKYNDCSPNEYRRKMLEWADGQ